MLDTHCQRKEEAEALYRRSLEVEPRHAFALYNLAVLLEEKHVQLEHAEQLANPALAAVAASVSAASANGPGPAALAWVKEKLGRRNEVCGFYNRAVEADSKDATTAADYGR